MVTDSVGAAMAHPRLVAGRRVVISNVYPDGNRGGSAITIATILAARAVMPRCAVTLVSTLLGSCGLERAYRHTLASVSDVEVVPALVAYGSPPLAGARAVGRSVGLLTAPYQFGARTLEQLSSADLVIGKGGQALGRIRYGARGAMSLWLTLFPLTAAVRLAIPTVAYSVTVGPFVVHDPGRAVAAGVIRRLDLVAARDALSKAESHRLGAHEGQVLEAPDCVFRFPAPPVSKVDSMLKAQELTRDRFVAITISGQEGRRTSFKRFLSVIGGATRLLLKRGVIDEVAVVVQGPSETDRPISWEFVTSLDDRRVRLIDDDLGPIELMALYAGAGAVLGGRVHSAIFSVVAGTPPFPLNLPGEVKAREIFRSVGLSERVVELATVTAEELAGQVQRTFENLSEERQRVQSAHAAARERVEVVDAQLHRLVSLS